MTMAVRGIVELFKHVNRENEVHRKLLAFSISHDAMLVRIYGHYAMIENRVATFWRHCLHTYDFTRNGREKWTAYRFTKNVYSEFSPDLHKLICSAIDQIPLGAVPQRSSLPQQAPLSDSFSTNPESERGDSQELASRTPGSQDTETFKKPRLTSNAILKEQVEDLRHQLSKRVGNESGFMTVLRQELELQRQENERMRQENERMRQENERQRQEFKEETEKHLDRISKLMETVQSLSASSK